MKILVVSNGYPPRGGFGTEFYTRELVHGLVRSGNAVSVLHPERGGGRARYELERVEEDGVPVFLLHNPGDPARRFRTSYRDEQVERVFGELLQRERPELVHFNYLLWGLSLRLPEVARGLGIPSVATMTDYGLLCHRGQMFDAGLKDCGGPHPPQRCARCIRTPLVSEHGPLARILRSVAAEGLAAVGGMQRVPVRADLERREQEVRRTFEALSFALVPTRRFMEVFAGAGVPRKKLVPLLYSFDEQPYRIPLTPEPGLTRFGYLGQFAPHKGLACLLRAARRLGTLCPDAAWELVLHGRPSVGRHQRYASELLAELPPHVRLAEPFAPQDAPRFLAGFSALMAPSEWDENAPLAILQARAIGLPVLATSVPGIAEIVDVPRQGRLVPVGDAEALAEAMAAVLRGELVAPIDAGLPLALPEHVARLEGLYAEALERREAGAHG